MNRDEVAEAIRAADARIEALLPLVRERPETPLLSGEWRVRDALSHVAARGNPVPRVLSRLEQAANPSGNQQPVRDIHEINAEQVQTRVDQDIDALIEELRAGHKQALLDLDGLSDEVLERRLQVAFDPGELSAGEFIVMAGPRHETNHMNDIEAALKA